MTMNTLNPTAAQAPAANIAAVATLTAPTDGSRWVLDSITYNYSAVPTNGLLTVAWAVGSSSFTENYNILAGGPGQLTWNQPKPFPSNTLVTITLAAGGASITCNVYPWAWTQ
jgi:hypothetical protein